MEVRTLCFRLLVTVILQLGAQTADAAFWIVPTRLQLFEYESVSFKCSGFDDLTGRSVLRKINGTKISACGLTNWGVSTESSCYVRAAFPDDTGEYWCEAGGGKRSNAVNVTVTGGSVILESPVLPVKQGDDVTLRCRTKAAASDHIADFYKDGVLVSSSFTREMIVHGVSKANEGLYKCRISDVGESAESWLPVRGRDQTQDHTDLRTQTGSSSELIFIIFRSIVPVVLMVVLLLLLGLIHYGDLRGRRVLCCDIKT